MVTIDFLSNEVAITGLNRLESRFAMDSSLELIWVGKLTVLLRRKEFDRAGQFVRTVIQKRCDRNSPSAGEADAKFHTEIMYHATRMFEVSYQITSELILY